MDEIKAIEKSLLGLKTIQNRLVKILKEKEPLDEITKLKARVFSLSEQVDEYYYKIGELESMICDYQRTLNIIKNQRRLLIDKDKKTRQTNLLDVYDIAGDDYNKKIYSEIILPERYIKFRKNGKWGLKDNKGKIIIENKYDEIGSCFSYYVGFINKEVQIIRDLPVYGYSIPLAGKFKYSNKVGYAFEVGGVDCYIPASSQIERWFVAGEYYYLIIDNITKGFKEIELMEVSFENTQVKRWKQNKL